MLSCISEVQLFLKLIVLAKNHNHITHKLWYWSQMAEKHRKDCQKTTQISGKKKDQSYVETCNKTFILQKKHKLKHPKDRVVNL
jgi:hypothetical protein